MSLAQNRAGGPGRVVSRPIAAAAIVLAAAFGYALNPTAPAAPRAPSSPATCPPPPSVVPRATQALRPQAPPRPTPQAAPVAAPPASDEGERAHRKEQSRVLMKLLRDRIGAAKRLAHATTPEAIANEVDLYLQGWGDAVMLGAPELTEELAAEVEQAMCSQDVEDGQLVVLTRALGYVPELANQQGLECLLARQNEDFVTWSALDAWSASAHRFEPSETLARLELNARDGRTLDRLRAIRSPQARADQEQE